MSTVFASFTDLESAQKAVGALLDHGATPADVSLVANEPTGTWRSHGAVINASEAEVQAKTGITTTTAGDAVIGAAKGGVVGVGVGILAALACLMIPGVGLVLGGGALATAIAGGVGVAAAGAATGGIAGYLDDQGMGPEVTTRYATAFALGSTVVSVEVPTGNLPPGFAEQMLAKYGATDVGTYHSTKVLMDDETLMIPAPVQSVTVDELGAAQVLSNAVVVDPSPVLSVEGDTEIVKML